MSRALGVRANAEGVEQRAQADLLLSEGCEEVQGYLFGRPMFANAFNELLSVPTSNHGGRPKDTEVTS